jgi:Pyridoxamine 5'-phosphate oxidase
MPEGYLGTRLLPWRWAEQRLARARNFWIATTSPDGSPHSRPVWGVWQDGRFFFSTGSRIGRNLDREPRVTVHLESGDEVVILEGRGERVSDPAVVERFVAAYNARYGWELTASEVEGLFSVRPRRAFGWLSDGSGEDGGALFGCTATRWRFDD